jgi:hypothetical protein
MRTSNGSTKSNTNSAGHDNELARISRASGRASACAGRRHQIWLQYWDYVLSNGSLGGDVASDPGGGAAAVDGEDGAVGEARAAASIASPRISPHCSKLRLLVTMIEPRS